MSCSELSLAAGLPLAGTAGRAERWLLLEHRSPWGQDGTDDSGLPEALVAWFREIDDRVHLIRRPGRPQGPPLAFAGRTTESGGSLVRLPIDRIEDVLDVDPARDGIPVEGPFVMVCTHARRDVCCGTYGVPVYNALRRHVPAGAALALLAPGRPPVCGKRPRVAGGGPAGTRRARGRGGGRTCTGRTADPASVLSGPHAARARGPGRRCGRADRARPRPSGGCPPRRTRGAARGPSHAERIGGGHRRGARGAAASCQLRQGGGADARSRRRPCTGSSPRPCDQPCLAPSSLYALSVIQENCAGIPSGVSPTATSCPNTMRA